MDGSSRSVIVNSGLSNTYALTIDYDSQTLYWADYSLDKIESVHVNGSSRAVITTTDVISPTGITFYEGVVYWSDQSDYRIKSVPVGSPGSATIEYSGSGYVPYEIYVGYIPYEIHVVSQQRQPQGA